MTAICDEGKTPSEPNELRVTHTPKIHLAKRDIVREKGPVLENGLSAPLGRRLVEQTAVVRCGAHDMFKPLLLPKHTAPDFRGVVAPCAAPLVGAERDAKAAPDAGFLPATATGALSWPSLCCGATGSSARMDVRTTGSAALGRRGRPSDGGGAPLAFHSATRP